jgi:predicted ferric reductase
MSSTQTIARASSSQAPTRSALTPNGERIARRYRRRLRGMDLLEANVYFSVAISIALFLADGGAVYFVNLTAWGDITRGLGIVLGLIGSDLLLVMLLLSARLPLLDRVFGHDKVIAQHRKLGKPVLYLILAHMVLLLVGYGLAENLNPVAEVFSMINTMPDMLLAFISVGLMVLVVVTSLVIVRRKLAYQFWHAVHLLAYVAVLAAIPHQFSNGALFADGKWARWYWIVLYVGTLASIVIFRFIVPAARSLRHNLVVSEVRREANDVVTITMLGRDLRSLPAKGGQFFNWRFLSAGLWLEAHPYSLSAAPDGTHLRISVRELGDASRRLLAMKPGTRVVFEGPYGLFSESARTTEQAVFICAGIGVTPLRAMLEDPNIGKRQATVILRGSTDEEVYLWNETYELCVAKEAWLRVLVGSRPSGVQTWLSAEAYNQGERLTTLAPNVKDSDVFICGPTPWTELVIRDARRAGVPEHRIHAERFDF